MIIDIEINFIFIPKRNGDQLEEFIDLILKNGKKIRYFIKTHRHGTTKTSSSTKDVDLKEVFIYKVLELLGIGEETHFFYDPMIKIFFYCCEGCRAFKKRKKQKILSQ